MNSIPVQFVICGIATTSKRGGLVMAAQHKRPGRTARTERQCRVEEQVDNLRYTLWAMDSLDKQWWRFPKTIFTDMNSSETLLWIIQRNFGIDLVAARDAVISKNRKRGYYGND